MEFCICAILLFFMCYGFWKYEQMKEAEAQEEQYVQETDNQDVMNKTMVVLSTRQLALNTIEKIGSEPQDTEEGHIQFEYQGVIFLMEAVNDCAFVNLIWPWCHSFSKFDIDEFARVRQVLNDINLQDTVSVVYTIADSDDVALHIRKNFIFIPQIPHIEDYLKLMLNDFFRTARTLELEIEKCRMQECEQQY